MIKNTKKILTIVLMMAVFYTSVSYAKADSQEESTDEKITYRTEFAEGEAEVTVYSDAFSEEVELRVNPVLWQEQVSFSAGNTEEILQVLDEERGNLLRENGSTPENSSVYDIRFVNNEGEEIEPASPAHVDLHLNSRNIGTSEVGSGVFSVTHLKETGEAESYEAETVAEITYDEIGVENNSDEDMYETEFGADANEEKSSEVDLSFDVESFSYFTVTFSDDTTVHAKLNVAYKITDDNGDIQDFEANRRDIIRVTDFEGEKITIKKNPVTADILGRAFPGGYVSDSIYANIDGEDRQILAIQEGTEGGVKGFYFYYGTGEADRKWFPYSEDQIPTLNVLLREDTQPLNTIETVDTSGEIRMHLVKYNESKINQGHALKFSSRPPQGGTPAMNKYVPNGFPGIVNSLLGEDGYPVLSTNGESLSYLFDEAKNNPAILKNFTVNHLFKKTETGDLLYDSRQNFATINPGGRLGNDIDGEKNFVVYDGPKQGSSPNRLAYYMPLNDLDQRKRIKSPYQYLMGMSVETTFLQPKNGTAANGDKIFEFYGDDDVWIFVDGVLVLDLGGIHDPLGGTINFATGEVKRFNRTGGVASTSNLADLIRRAKGENTPGLLGNTLKDYTSHTLKVFYFERGAGGSNLKMRFNVNSLPDRNLFVGKNVSHRPQNLPSDVKYKYLIEIQHYTENGYEEDFSPYSGNYSVFRGDVVDYTHAEKVADRTTENGVVEIKNGEYINIGKESLRDPRDRYRITEYVGESGKTYVNLYNVTSNLGDVTARKITVDRYNYDGYTVSGRLEDGPMVIYDNEVQTEHLGYLIVEKEMKPGHSSDDSFPVEVKIDGTLYSGSYELFGEDETDYSVEKTEKQSTADGIIYLQKGQKAVIRGLLWESEYEIFEKLDGLEGYVEPNYYRQVSDDINGEQFIEKTELRDGKVYGRIPVEADGNVRIKIENSKEQPDETFEVPPTGINLPVAVYIVMIGVGAMFLPMFLANILFRRRRIKTKDQKILK